MHFGGKTLLVGDADGQVHAWHVAVFEDAATGESGLQTLTRAHTFSGGGGAVIDLTPSVRDRSVVVLTEGGEVRAELPLPLAGLMTDRSLSETRAELYRLDEVARELGCTLPAPYMALSFLGLAVVPELRLTDLGLVDVPQGRIVPFQAEPRD